MRAACTSIASPPKATAGPDAASAANPTAAAVNIDRCICDTSETQVYTSGFGRLKSTAPLVIELRAVAADGSGSGGECAAQHFLSAHTKAAFIEQSSDCNGLWSAAVSKWGRALSAAGGLAMVVGGFLVLNGSRSGYLLVAGATVVVVVGALAGGRRSG